MKTFIAMGIAAMLLCAGCGHKKASSCPYDKSAGKSSEPACRVQPAIPGFTGVVSETINTAGYTYALVDTGNAKVWAVGPAVGIKTGDTVIVSGIMPMQNYKSKTLHRTFDLVYFAGSIARKGQQSSSSEAMAGGHAMMGSSPVPLANMDFSEIKKPPQAKTISEIYAQKDELAGKRVVIAARVVKATYGVLGKNWIHVQDGTGASGTNDLAVTTDAMNKPGQTVIVNGILSKDKDIGAGYKYSVIIENATVTIDK